MTACRKENILSSCYFCVSVKVIKSYMVCVNDERSTYKLFVKSDYGKCVWTDPVEM